MFVARIVRWVTSKQLKCACMACVMSLVSPFREGVERGTTKHCWMLFSSTNWVWDRNQTRVYHLGNRYPPKPWAGTRLAAQIGLHGLEGPVLPPLATPPLPHQIASYTLHLNISDNIHQTHMPVMPSTLTTCFSRGSCQWLNIVGYNLTNHLVTYKVR